MSLCRKFAQCATAICLAVFLVLADLPEGHAEYGDVVMNRLSDKNGIRPVIFPHWFHRIRYTCKVCHAELGFKMQAGGNSITMTDIIDGKYCGSCHNNDIAWATENCDLCHSATPGLPTGVFGGHETLGPGRW